MEELMKSLEGSKGKQKESLEDNLPKQVNGVLAVHVKTLQLVDPEMDSSVVDLLQLRVKVCGHAKHLSLLGPIQDGTIVCNKVRHFVVKLPERKDDEENLVDVGLFISSPLLPGYVSLLGQAALHLHDIIHDIHFSGHCELKGSTGATFANLTAELIFGYGSYGYGESLQLQPVCGHKPQEHLYHSAFPRLTPHDHRVDVNGLTLTPHPTKQPVFIPFDRHAQLCVKESTTEAGIEAERTPRLLMNRMTRLRPLHWQYKAIKDRRHRLRFLEETVLSDQDKPEQSESNLGVTARTLRLNLDVNA